MGWQTAPLERQHQPRKTPRDGRGGVGAAGHPGAHPLNHLAHTFLAARDPDSLIGNLIADDVRGRPEGRFAEGIMMHRRIDTFVDAHPATTRSIALLPSTHRRYGGIMLDVLHDHFLAKEWQAWSSLDLPDFAGQIYAELSNNESELPAPFRLRMPRMVANRWLESFTDLEVVDRILRHISTRLRRENPLIDGASVLHPHLTELRAEFHILLPDTIAYARNLSPNAVWST